MPPQQQTPFEQSTTYAPPLRDFASRGIADISQEPQPQQPWRQSDIFRAWHHGLADGIGPGDSALVDIRRRTLSSAVFDAGSPSRVLAFESARASPTAELERIRSLLSQGLLRDARSLVTEAMLRFPNSEALYALSKITARSEPRRTATKFPRRDAEIQWLQQHRDQYKGRWVALLGSELIATADSMKGVLDQVAEKQLQGSPLVHKVE